jgi:hypothetical protein
MVTKQDGIMVHVRLNPDLVKEFKENGLVMKHVATMLLRTYLERIKALNHAQVQEFNSILAEA